MMMMMMTLLRNGWNVEKQVRKLRWETHYTGAKLYPRGNSNNYMYMFVVVWGDLCLSDTNSLVKVSIVSWDLVRNGLVKKKPLATPASIPFVITTILNKSYVLVMFLLDLDISLMQN